VRAIVLSEFGPPELLIPQEVDEPTPGSGQVLIDVELANVTFVETQVRAGRAPHPSMLPELPAIPGNGVGGVVVAVGPGADRALIGTRVVSTTGGAGGYAERVAVTAEGIVPVPDGVSLPEAVALLADGRTAMGLIDRAALRPGETVLVEAAAGGVGSLLVQLAKAAGAHVIAVAGGERKLAVARELGADIAIDYMGEKWASEVASAATGIASNVDGAVADVVFDGVGGAVGRTAFELLRPGGRHCAFGMASGAFAAIDEAEAARRSVTLLRGAVPSPQEMTALTRAALQRAAAGELRAVIGQTFPLEHAAEAHRAIEGRATIGKTLLVVRGA
jgi:NADPH2:quinone reductase